MPCDSEDTTAPKTASRGTRWRSNQLSSPGPPGEVPNEVRRRGSCFDFSSISHQRHPKTPSVTLRVPPPPEARGRRKRAVRYDLDFEMESEQVAYCKSLIKHLTKCWAVSPRRVAPRPSNFCELHRSFQVLEFVPTKKRNSWIYATCGMANRDGGNVELFLISPVQHDSHADLLGAIAHYHLTESALGLNHTVHFGIPWFEGSLCSYGLISLPYLDGPSMERFSFGGETVRCLWLIPITEDEKIFVNEHGIEALEAVFDSVDFDYRDPNRRSVV